MIIMKNHYEHRDFYLGAYLVTNGCRLVKHKRHQGVTTFIFEETDQLKKLVDNFYSLNGTVDALSYSSAIRSLKSVIHSAKSNPKSEELNHEFNNNKRNNI